MQQRTQLNAYPPRASRHGTSLIEVLVVLVILVIGILSIVRLFPAGFIALRHAENNTFADRLAQGALEGLKRGGNGLPDAVYMYTDDQGFVPNIAPDDFGPYAVNGTALADYNDINKQRYISNETITVPGSHLNSSSMVTPPLHALRYGPIYLPKDYATVPVPTISLHYLPVKSLPWTPQVGDSRLNPSDIASNRAIDNPPDILQSGSQTFLVDAAAGKIAVPQKPYDQIFTLSVATTTGGPQTLNFLVKATTVNPVGGYDGNWVGASDMVLFDPANQNANVPLPAGPWVAGSAVLYRPFKYMGIYGQASAANFTPDPYEFAVYNGPNGASQVGQNSNMGVLAFNPLASGQAGAQALKARISYEVQDWHILHEDRDIAPGSATVRLTLGHLKKLGDVQFDQTTFSSLLPNAVSPADIVILDLDTGAVTNLAAPQSGANGGNTFNDDDNTGNGSNTTPAAGQYSVSYQNGRVTFPSNSQASHVRVFYAGDADWALAIQKSPSNYVRSLNAAGSDDVVPLSQTSLQKATNPNVPPTPNLYAVDAATQRVYFPLADAGKTVEFDGITAFQGTAVAAQVGVGTATISADLAANGLPYVNLSGQGLNNSGILTNSNYNKVTFQAVRGVSARAIVIWRERNNWRSRAIDTLLTQNQ